MRELAISHYNLIRKTWIPTVFFVVIPTLVIRGPWILGVKLEYDEFYHILWVPVASIYPETDVRKPANRTNQVCGHSFESC